MKKLDTMAIINNIKKFEYIAKSDKHKIIHQKESLINTEKGPSTSYMHRTVTFTRKNFTRWESFKSHNQGKVL